MRRNRCATWHPAVLRGAEWMQRAWGARPWRCGSQRQAAASAWRPPVSSTTHTRPRAEPASCDEHGMPHGRPLGYAARRSSSARRGLNVRRWRPRRRLAQRADQVPVPRKGTRAVSTEAREHVGKESVGGPAYLVYRSKRRVEDLRNQGPEKAVRPL